MLRSETVRTVLIASSGLVRVGLTAVLRETRFSIVESSTSLDTPDAVIQESAAGGLIIAAIDAPKTASLLIDVMSRQSDLKLVILVSHDEGRLLPPGLLDSASAVLDTSVSNEVLLGVLDLVSAGLRIQVRGASSPSANYGTPESAWGASDLVNHSADRKPPQNLSPRELEVLQGLSMGSSNKLIARNFDIAEATVKVHVKSVLRKIKAQNRTQAAIWARENGICAQATTAQQSAILAA
ncbi:response regulator transcription factor [Methylobacterium nigriterrae]|uniref:response regulator transcription factor n=1 Tax=Methylobacterium nigriterrae TaxID=3127512 RepID=UPI00301322C1